MNRSQKNILKAPILKIYHRFSTIINCDNWLEKVELIVLLNSITSIIHSLKYKKMH